MGRTSTTYGIPTAGCQFIARFVAMLLLVSAMLGGVAHAQIRPLDPPSDFAPGQQPAPPNDSAPNEPPTADPNAPSDTPEGPPADYVWAKDFADQLRTIDPAAKINWEETLLRVTAGGQRFSLFLRRNEMVANGVVEKFNGRPIRVVNDEIYVSSEAVERVGKLLEAGPPPAVETTAPVVLTPTPIQTPWETPPVATPAPTATPGTTPKPNVTPSGTPVFIPAGGATPTPSVQATPAPTPSPTPTPEPTPEPPPSSSPGTNAVLEQALREKIALKNFNIPARSASDLANLAAVRQVKTVVIDPDDGDIARLNNRGRDASELSLAIAKKVAARLESSGMRAVLTRDTEVRMPLGRRLETVARSGAQALVSIKIGNNTFSDVAGSAVFYPSDVVDYPVPSAPVAAGAVAPEQVYAPFAPQSAILARALESSLKGVGKGPSGAGGPAPLYIHRRAPMASALIVAGYLSNIDDLRRLRSETEQNAIADAIASGIAEFARERSSSSEVTARPTGGRP